MGFTEDVSRQNDLGFCQAECHGHDLCSTPALVLRIVFAFWMLVPVLATGQDTSNSHALSALFNERHVVESAWYVRSQTRNLTPADRYKYLSSWVLPGESHPNFRLGLAFVPTDPSSPVLERYKLDPEHHSWFPIGIATIERGGYPISPVFDLIHAAAEVGNLDEVRSRIEDAVVEGEFQERCRLALLILVDIARQDYPPAVTHLDDLAARLREQAFEEYQKRWPETVAAWVGVQHPETRIAADELLFGMLNNQVRTGYARGPDEWDRSVAALAGLLAYDAALGDEADRKSLVSKRPFELEHWSPLSRTTALTRGYGFPGTSWMTEPGRIEKVAGHNEDYLMYHSPLRGNFELECDVSYFGWTDCHLSVTGVWVAPTKDQQIIDLGEFRSARPSLTLSPPMSLYGDSIHCRVVVRDRICTTYFNGRLVHEERLPEQHDPWIAIRSPWNAHSDVRGLRITGAPDIPGQVRLSALPDLTGWTAYYDESVGQNAYHWRHLSEPGSDGVIVGQRRDDLSGTFEESLLRYQRPMFEDGTIEYEFFYEEGSTLVHPAFDRRVFLLAPDGVRLHWLTDGVYDSTGLDPDNSTVEPQCRRGPARPPLKQAQWNRLKLSLTGDSVGLTLNGELIYQCKLEPANRRTFGLFHYSDRTEARVRNIVWTGDWPRSLPPVADQPQVDHTLDFLDDDLAKLEAVYEHDFVEDDYPARDILVRGQEIEKLVTKTPQGLQVQTMPFENFRPTYISPKLIVEADFDIIAEFENLTTQAAANGASGISIRAILEDELEQRTVYRGLVQHLPAPQRQLMESIFIQNVNQKAKMSYHGVTSQESTSGRLRLARRGDTLYCLFAERDSSLFQLVSKGPYRADRLRLEGVRLMTATQGATGSASVVWKHLTIRAEEIIRKY